MEMLLAFRTLDGYKFKSSDFLDACTNGVVAVVENGPGVSLGFVVRETDVRGTRRCNGTVSLRQGRLPMSTATSAVS